MIGGCEPYTFDFGDREYGEWLREHLSPAEYAKRDELFERWWALHSRTRWAPWRVRALIGWRRRRAYERFDRLAEERAERPPPGPSWKIRREWGTTS